MNWTVYIIYSKVGDTYYKGISSNPEKRLYEHRNGLSRYTSKYNDWELKYSKEFGTKGEALIEERRLKRLNRRSLELLIKDEGG
jgi:putative endonuclease